MRTTSANPTGLKDRWSICIVMPKSAVLGSQLTIIDHASQVIGWRSYPTAHAAIVESMRRFNPLAHPSVIFRKNFVRNAGGYLPYPGNEDYELWSRLAGQGAGFGNHPEALLRYRIHPAPGRLPGSKR